MVEAANLTERRPEWVEECSAGDGIYKVWKKKQKPNTEDKK
jgi:hypothetical protein